MERPGLAVLIPAYNEAATIASVVEKARRHGDVIVVDDCSTDDTADIARSCGAHVERNVINRGYEENLNRLFQIAAERGYAYAVTMDADGEHDPKYLACFQEKLVDRGIPLVLGIRPRKQRISEVAMGYFIKWRYGVDDILCGMKGYDLSLWHRHGAFDTQKLIGTELAISAIHEGTRFTQLAIDGTPREDEPRFDRLWKANLRIFDALRKTLIAPPRLDCNHANSKK